MAYKNLYAQVCTDKQEFVQRFRDFVCARNGTYDYSTTGIGWTLIDSVYAVDEDNMAVNDYFVIYSPGENGGQDLYFKCAWVLNYIKVSGYLSWDPATHTGSLINYATASNLYSIEATVNAELSVYGDLDMIMGNWDGKTLAYSYSCHFGALLPGYSDLDDTVLNTTGAVSSGSDVVLTMDGTLPAAWVEDAEVFIRTTHRSPITTTKIEKVVIKAVSGVTITVDLVNDYTTAAAVSSHVGYYCADSYQHLAASRTLISASGSADNIACTHGYFSTLTLAAYDPENFEDRYMMYDIAWQVANIGLIGIAKNLYKLSNFVLPMAPGEVLEVGADSFRCFYSFSGQYFCVREV